MPALVRRGPFSYDSLSRSGTNNYTLTNAKFDANNGEILEVLVDGVKLEGDGSVANATDAGNKSPAHGFYVDSLTAPTKISLVSNPASGTIKIYRLSNRSAAQVDFAPGSVIREQDLDNSTNQTLHVAQEAMDIALSGVVLAADDKWDANSKVIKSVADGVSGNDAVNKTQLTATEVTTLAYKEDTEDYKLEAGDWATKVNGVVNTYTDNVAQSDGTDQSAKAYAIGGTGVTQTASKGAAKEWAIGSGRIDDQSSGDYSSKEWATGTTATSSKTYATKVDGAVTGTDFSSKAWAVGGTNVTTTGSRGAAKEWATTTGGAVDTSEFSAKEYAVGSTATLGSAKEWALGGGGSFTEATEVVSGLYSARKYASDASASQLSAKASAAAVASTFDKFDDTYLGSMADGATATDADTTGTWAKNSNVITVASATNIVVGQEVTGAGIPTDANVIVVSGTSITISENMTAAGSGVDLDFRGQGVYGAFNGTKDGPSTDNDGGALANGMLYFNTTDNSMKVYKETGAAWIKTSASGGVSLVMHKATASGTPTSFAASDFTPTLSYEVNNIIVWLNGVKLDATDYTATNGTTVVLASAAANSDELVVLAFKTFEVGDAVSAASGGTFGGAVTFGAGLSSTTGTFSGAVTNSSTTTATGLITANGGLETDTNSKIKQKGAFMQSSTHQALVLGG